MFKIVGRVVLGLLAGIGLWTVGSKLVNKYYESLDDADAEFDMDEYVDEDDCGDCCSCHEDKDTTEEKTEE